MSIKTILLLAALSTIYLPIGSANANPSSCKAAAITPLEKKAVKVLQDMYGLQAKMNIISKNLDELNHQRRAGYNAYDSNSVNRYNEIINKYNNTVRQKNTASNEYNQLKNLFNATINQISPSTNIGFTSCLNVAVLGLEVNTTKINVDATGLNIDSTSIETENLRRRIENVRY